MAFNTPPSKRPLEPEMRRRLLEEVRTPWRGLRRALWLALAASGGIGLAAMALRSASGEAVAPLDLVIQVGALLLFGGLLWLDRRRDSTEALKS